MTKRWLFPQFIYFLTGPFRMISVWISATVATVFWAKTEYLNRKGNLPVGIL